MKILHQIKKPITYLLLPMLIGLTVVFAAEIFVNSFVFLNRLWISPSNGFSWVHFLIPFIGAPFIIYLIKKTKDQRPYNHVDIVSKIHTYNSAVDVKSNASSILASLVALGSGFSVGYYGPVLQLGSVLGNCLTKLKYFISTTHPYVYVGAGAAAAIASIFHTPIGAVVFVHEVLFSFFSTRAFAPVTISAVTAYVASTKIFGDGVTFVVVPHASPELLLYIFVAVAGLLAGGLGVCFSKSVLSVQRKFNKEQYSMTTRVLLAATTISFLGGFFPEIFSASIPFLDKLLLGGYQDGFVLLFFILLTKFIVTVFGVGLGIPGGIFGPSVFFGATLGAFLSVICTYFFPEIDTSVLLVTTMAASTSAIMGAPIAMIIIATELTDDYALSSAVMLAVIMANITSYRLLGVSSFSDLMLREKGLDLSAGRDQFYLKTKNMSLILSEDYLVILKEVSLPDARTMLIQTRREQACVVDKDNCYLGMVFLIDIERILSNDTKADLTVMSAVDDKKPFYHHTSLWEAMLFMQDFHGEMIALLDDEKTGKLLGVIYEKDLIKYYFETLSYLRNQESVTTSFIKK